MTSSTVAKAPVHLRLRRPLRQLDVVPGHPGAERQWMLRDDHVDGLEGVVLGDRPRRHYAIHAEAGDGCQKHGDEDHDDCAFVPIHDFSPTYYDFYLSHSVTSVPTAIGNAYARRGPRAPSSVNSSTGRIPMTRQWVRSIHRLRHAVLRYP